jgi:hypothetical protein
VLGGDHLLANILKAYVHLLQDKVPVYSIKFNLYFLIFKACKEDWLNYLRFSLVIPPTSAVGRLLSQVAGFGGYSEAIWKVLFRVSRAFNETNAAGINAAVLEHNEIRACLSSLTKCQNGQRCTNLQIGEVMLQMQSTNLTPQAKLDQIQDQEGKSQVCL